MSESCASASSRHLFVEEKYPLSARDFYDLFVLRRRPVLMRRQCAALLDNPDILNQLNSVEKLVNLVGVEQSKQSTVEVNVRSQSAEKGTSGKDQEAAPSTHLPSFSPPLGSRVVEMPFAEFCSKLEAGSDEYYMTTQTLPVDEEGRPAVYNWFTHNLLQKKIFTLRPAILGNLIPMNAANVWMGRTSADTTSGDEKTTPADTSDARKESGTGGFPPAGASSSGLHHDMHDNLYCLVLGRKTIRIAPPSAVRKCKMVGKLHTIHPNGRIVYNEQLEGASSTMDNDDCPIRPDGALASVERILQLEIRKESVEHQLSSLEGDAHTNRKELEDQLNEIEEELLDIELEGNSEGGESDSESGEEISGTLFGPTRGADCNDNPGANKRRKVTPPFIPAAMSKGCTNSNSIGRSGVDRQEVLPPNFVKEECDQVQFELVHLRAGDALYLPAGWFHEVFSHGDKTQDGIHMAVNYWVHPPDVGSGVTFEKPYASEFWQRDWDAKRLVGSKNKGAGVIRSLLISATT